MIKGKNISLKELQMISLNILEYFHNICEEHNIKYSLGGGTLIGAIRHQGFIPWDDDIDVYMLWSEYQKFVSVWNKFNHDYYQLSPIETFDGDVAGEMAKIYDMRTYLAERHRSSHIFIDIFVLDYVPSDLDLLYKSMKKHRRLKLRFSSLKKRFYRAKDNSLMKKIFGKLAQFFYQKMQTNLSWLRENYNEKNSENIGLFLSDYGGWQKSYMPKEYFSKFEKVKFEDKYFYVTKNYHEHLTDYYGNYMQLPPENERMPKHGTWNMEHGTWNVYWKE
ncbi:LicD family protein [Canicola haemoglobinophilus]|uniref:LicD family protein n=1 Tax=Canicola haemoglobinophilus TaxID=733 RepID=A0AB38H857_9PAST|nr:LicD family protein [Canicola haemoglobinophilus]STO53772.1 LicD family protein [Canicola haemoglobinophilus]STO68305.1 LicD family protein [Canicola haemoglobinophilus]